MDIQCLPNEKEKKLEGECFTAPMHASAYDY